MREIEEVGMMVRAVLGVRKGEKFEGKRFRMESDGFGGSPSFTITIITCR